VCGILGDKDIESIISALAGRVDRWIAVGLSGARVLAADELARRITIVTGHAADVAGDVEGGLRMAQALSAPGDRVLVFGSFLTVGPALASLGAAA
jgi:dihydrofolate synthase/folylpolyglutamate synthase